MSLRIVDRLGQVFMIVKKISNACAERNDLWKMIEASDIEQGAKDKIQEALSRPLQTGYLYVDSGEIAMYNGYIARIS
jgi:hypothetical protein